ncbi:hypothetical protein Chor_014393 [Crotalus horridus]
MLSFLLIQMLLSIVSWGPVNMTAILSFLPYQLFTMESLSNMIETEAPKQASTVPFGKDPERNEIEPVTDGGNQASSQTVITSLATSSSNGVDGVVNKNLPEPATMTVGPKQQMAFKLFTAANTRQAFPGKGDSRDENSGSTHMARLAIRKGQLQHLTGIGQELIAERGDSSSKLLSGQTEELDGSNNSPCQRGDKGEVGNRGPRGFRGHKGENGELSTKGDCGLKGNSGEKGERGFVGRKGAKGLAGTPGSQGPPGLKGDPGRQGKMDSSGFQGMPGL